MLRSGKPKGCTRVCLRGFFRAVPWRGVRLERSQKLARDRGYLVDSGSECGFVCLRRLVEAAHFSHELRRGSTNLVLGDWGFEIEQDPDVSAHGVGSTEKTGEPVFHRQDVGLSKWLRGNIAGARFIGFR